MHVLLLAGGNSNERDVSLRSGNAVEAGLKAAGYKVTREDPGAMGFNLKTAADSTDVVFIVLHGSGGEDGAIQEQLETIGIPYTGCGVEASKLCWDKWSYKNFLQSRDIPVSVGKMVSKEDLDDPLFKEPFVLKPAQGGSSLDTLIAREVTKENLDTAKELLNKYPSLLLERLVFGKEITLTILGNQPLEVIEIIPPEHGEFDYENKYNGATQEIIPPRNVSNEAQKKAQELALRIHSMTGCRDISRTDMIVDNNDELHVLETNTIPGMSDQSLVPKAAARAGYDMSALCDLLVGLALKH